MHDDVKAAEEALIKLSKIYQFLVSHSDKKVILFDEEWSFMKNYLDIQQLMFKDAYTITINKEGDFRNVFVPPLVLQPLVGNIFKYAFIGINYKGEIKIDAVREDDTIYITICDNGVGFPEDDIFGSSLGNIKKRLRKHYENAQFIAENRTPPEKGAKVMMVFSVE